MRIGENFSFYFFYLVRSGENFSFYFSLFGEIW